MKIYQLLNDKSKWNRFQIALDKDGKNVEATSARTICFSIEGAIRRCYPINEYHPERKILDEKMKELRKTQPRYYCWQYYNEEHSYEEIINLVRELDV